MKKVFSLFLVFLMFFTCIPISGCIQVNAKEKGTVQASDSNGMTESASIQNDISSSGTNSVGKMVSKAIENSENSKVDNKGYCVYSVELAGKEATVSYETSREATLIVAIYEEDAKKMLGTGITVIKEEETEAKVDIDIDHMPKYFYVKAYIVDTDTWKPLCSVYDSPNYTQEMQEFFCKDISDFSEEKTLNLDESEKNNFGVYDSDVVVIEERQEENIISKGETENTYVINNIDNEVSKLEKGDLVSIETAKGETIIMKISSIEIEGTMAVVEGGDAEIEDVFSYLRIDSSCDESEAEYDGTTCDKELQQIEGENEDISFAKANKKKANGEVSVSTGLSFKFLDAESLTGKVGYKSSFSLKYYITTSYQYLELKNDYSLSVDIGIKQELYSDKLWKIGELIYAPLPGIYITLTPAIVLECDVTLSVKGTLKGTIGFYASNEEGIKNISSKPSFKTEMKVEGEVFIGISLEPAVKILSDKVAKAGLEAKVGVEISAEKTYFSSSAIQHECEDCIAGEIKGKVEVSFSVKFIGLKELKLSREYSVKITDFYYSVDKKEFGFSTCPYLKYKVTCTVKEEWGVVENANIDTGEMNVMTDEKGQATFWQVGGRHTAHVTCEGYDEANKYYTITDRGKSLVINLNRENSTTYDAEEAIPGKVRKIIRGNTNAVITEDDVLYMWGENEYGQLGNGTTDEQYKPIKVMEDVKDVSESTLERNIFVITNDDSLYIWGKNDYGQVGYKTSQQNVCTPVKVLENIKEVKESFNMIAALGTDGSLYTWGENWSGSLGNGTFDDCFTPTKVLTNVKDFNVATTFEAVSENGELYTWGSDGTYEWECELGQGKSGNTCKPQIILTGVEAIPEHGVAISKNGEVYMWGVIDHSLGIDGKITVCEKPTLLITNVKQIIGTDMDTMFIDDDDSLYSWNVRKGSKLLLRDVKVVEEKETNRRIAITNDGKLYELYEKTGDNPEWATSFVMNDVKGVKGNGGGEYFIVLQDGTVYKKDGYGSNASVVRIEIPEPISYIECASNCQGAISEGGNLYTWGYYPGNGSEGVLWNPINLNYTYAKKQSKKTLNKTTVNPKGTLTYTDLEPYTTYNIYAFRTPNARKVMSTYNLIYVSQITTDEEGKLSLDYELVDASFQKAVFILKKDTCKSISSVSVDVNNIEYNKKERFASVSVNDGDIRLEQGKDYELEGDYSARDIGDYRITIKGIGDYDGRTTEEYQVVCSCWKYYGDWQVRKEATEDTTGLKYRICSMCGSEDTEIIERKSSKKQNVSSGISQQSPLRNENGNTNVKKVATGTLGKGKIDSIYSKKSKEIVIKIRKVAGAKGYQIQYATNRKFKKQKSKLTKKTKYTIKKLKKKKTYYVRVRAYKLSGKTKIYGKWSTVKKIKVKKG